MSINNRIVDANKSKQKVTTCNNDMHTTTSKNDPITQNAIKSRLPRNSKLKNWQNYKSDEFEQFGFKISVKASLVGEYAQQTTEAIVDEIKKNILDFQVRHYIRFRDIPEEHRKSNVLSTFMFIKHKMKADGRYDKTKARLVVDESNKGKHMYDFISSTTVSLSLVFVLFNIASYFKCHMVAYDIKGAFLNAVFTKDR